MYDFSGKCQLLLMFCISNTDAKKKFEFVSLHSVAKFSHKKALNCKHCEIVFMLSLLKIDKKNVLEDIQYDQSFFFFFCFGFT